MAQRQREAHTRAVGLWHWQRSASQSSARCSAVSQPTHREPAPQVTSANGADGTESACTWSPRSAKGRNNQAFTSHKGRRRHTRRVFQRAKAPNPVPLCCRCAHTATHARPDLWVSAAPASSPHGPHPPRALRFITERLSCRRLPAPPASPCPSTVDSRRVRSSSSPPPRHPDHSKRATSARSPQRRPAPVGRCALRDPLPTFWPRACPPPCLSHPTMVIAADL